MNTILFFAAGSAALLGACGTVYLFWFHLRLTPARPLEPVRFDLDPGYYRRDTT